MINLSLLSLYNPWWKADKVPEEKAGKKRVFLEQILPDLPRKQILLVSGLRRVGKTTLIYQIVQHLLNKGVRPLEILYFSFEEEKEELLELLEVYEQEVLKEKLERKSQIYFFLDEVQKLGNWAGKLKRVYDLFPNLKIVASGSAALNIEKEGKESLAGRALFYLLEPLSFKEYLKFKGIEFDFRRVGLYQKELQAAISDYFLESGFIEIIGEKKEFIYRYFKELLIERVIYKDIPQIFSLDDPELAFRLLKTIAFAPGILVDYRMLANDLQRDWRTIKKYLDLLEYSLLVKKLYNYSPNLLTAERKLKRYYPAVPAISGSLFSQETESEAFQGKLVETLLIGQANGKFFWRNPQGKEVDLVIEKRAGKEVLPIEIKYQNKISKKDLSGLLAFCQRFKLSRALLITKNTKKEEKIGKMVISLVPLWLFLLEPSF